MNFVLMLAFVHEVVVIYYPKEWFQLPDFFAAVIWREGIKTRRVGFKFFTL